MHLKLIALLGLAVMAVDVLADEKLPVLKVAGETFSNVTVTKVSSTDIYFSSSQGLRNAKLKDLDPLMQKHFQAAASKAPAPRSAAALNGRYHFRVASPTNMPVSAADIKTELADALARVREIVNQPVASRPRTADMDVSIYGPGWFHPGAIRPDFDTVDVRASQELTYAKHQYATSDLNPDIVYAGNELEFNSMTKYFYTDRSVPKKRLTDGEMQEINRLYRIIGNDEKRLAKQ